MRTASADTSAPAPHRWPKVYVDDLADLLLLATERAHPGARAAPDTSGAARYQVFAGEVGMALSNSTVPVGTRRGRTEIVLHHSIQKPHRGIGRAAAQGV